MDAVGIARMEEHTSACCAWETTRTRTARRSRERLVGKERRSRDTAPVETTSLQTRKKKL